MADRDDPERAGGVGDVADGLRELAEDALGVGGRGRVAERPAGGRLPHPRRVGDGDRTGDVGQDALGVEVLEHPVGDGGTLGVADEQHLLLGAGGQLVVDVAARGLGAGADRLLPALEAGAAHGAGAGAALRAERDHRTGRGDPHALERDAAALLLGLGGELVGDRRDHLAGLVLLALPVAVDADDEDVDAPAGTLGGGRGRRGRRGQVGAVHTGRADLDTLGLGGQEEAGHETDRRELSNRGCEPGYGRFLADSSGPDAHRGHLSSPP